MSKVKKKLRVFHQIIGVSKIFTQEVETEEEALAVYNAIADTMLFLYGRNVIGDYDNVIGVEMYDEDDAEWVAYYDEEEDKDWGEVKSEIQNKYE